MPNSMTRGMGCGSLSGSLAWLGRGSALALCALTVTGASQGWAEEMMCGLQQLDLSKARRLTPEQMETLSLEAPGSGPFQIEIVAGPGLQANPAALAALTRAAEQWEARIRDPITVTINADLGSTTPGALATTSPVVLVADLDTVASGLTMDGADEPADVAAQRFLEVAAAFTVSLPAGKTFDGNVAINKATAKALTAQGLDEMFGVSDGTIVFSTAFPFDFDNRDGVAANLSDFESAAVHEIGHALGFTSLVDGVESPATPPAVPVSTLDLFRFEASPAGLPDQTDFAVRSRLVRGGVAAMFDDIDHELELSTGQLGDGRQASHWKADELTGILLGVMDPTLSRGQRLAISAADLRALDVIGYEIAAAEAPPEVAITVNGAPVNGPSVVVAANQTIQFQSQVTDGDGLGFPAFRGFGSVNLVSVIWDFFGIQPVNGALAIFGLTPQVRFDLPPNSPNRIFPVTFFAFDTLGDQTTRPIDVLASLPPSVVTRANGDPLATGGGGAGTLSPFIVRARSGQPVQLEAFASDSDGLGFPAFAGFGNSTPVTYIWDFGGGAPQGPLSLFTQNPVVTFNLAPGEQSRVFPVSLIVFDALGLRTDVRGGVEVTRSGPPVVSITVNGVNQGSSTTTLSLIARSPGLSLQLGANAFDENGFGFPIFAAFGVPNPVSFSWSFGGGVPTNPLDIFIANPRVLFTVPPGQTQTFAVSLAVIDTTGLSTTRNVNLVITNPDPQ